MSDGRALEITVIGTPGPQGSKSFKGMRGGHAILTESSKKVAPWRLAVVYAARLAMNGGPGVSGPVRAEMIFTLPKPKSASKRKRSWPDRKPDLSKLQRSTEDALTDAGAWEDDARLVRCASEKVFPGEHPDALDVPGAVIRIFEVVEEIL